MNMLNIQVVACEFFGWLRVLGFLVELSRAMTGFRTF